ncbi:hypothetical protein QYE76_029438 [Lolium multiflorum]|uniref:DUF4218 domain-containing protein n=1 Tax=Lolium multiflorum TaxID=4521 RepID=A0AAD8VIA5_LOLMU|nr:hypothetical protein QYE76_029438 [Lolium multiflorum]
MVDHTGVQAMVDPTGVQAMVDPTGVQAKVDPSGVQAKVDPRRSFLRRFTNSNNTEASSSVVNNDPDTHSSSPEDSSNARDEIDQLLLDGFDMYPRSSSEEEEGSEDDSEDEDVETYKRLVNDGGQQLYPGCKKFSKLQFLVRLLNIKNVRGMTNAAFEDMLTLFREALPEGHSLPKKFHEAKQYIRGVGLAYDTYDVCFNDCIIFRGIHANANVCPVCKTSRWKTERSVVGGKRISRVARKVIRHFPLKKRVRRLFISNKTTALMSWHNDGRTKDEVMRHPADSPAWKNFDSRYRSFSKEPRNIRFGLATDGFNPFRNMNLSYSIWPIILIPYNFPPWICMKETNFILSVIVPGRRSPGKDIDVYLQLVIDELQELWHHGVLVHDAHFGKKFRVYAALLWTISDWLGRGILSGESIVVCSHCLLGTCSRRLKHGHKACFLGHRRFLSRDHAFRRDEESFDGTTDFRDPPVQPTGEEISAMTMDIQTAYGKLQKQKRSGRKKRSRGEGDEDLENKEEVHTVESTFKKRSIFFQLEYWEFLLVRHNLDSMHIEKNVFDNIVNTLLDVDKRSKDNANARMDMKRMKIREHLHIDETQEKPDLPDAVYYMESSKKKMFCGLVKNVRFPDNHASSMYNKVRLEENKFVGLKTHDCHILFEEILPLAVMKTLPEEVALPLVKLAKCFKVITSKIVSNKEIAIVEDQLPEILCELEKIFPPTFFDIMEHLVIHLPTEVRLAGPVQFRNMWSTEMFIGNMKNWEQIIHLIYVRTNKSDTQEWKEKMIKVGEAVAAGSNGDNMLERFIHIAKATGYLPGNQQIVENKTIYEQLEEDEDDDDDEDDSDEEDDEEEDGAEDGHRANDGEGYDSDATIDPGTEEEKSHRGPTLLKGFWKHVNPNCKIDVEFNDNGQPCGPNTSHFSNFIGSLVKGKEISMAATSWSKVPRSEKMHLWETVKAFFNVEERHRLDVARLEASDLDQTDVALLGFSLAGLRLGFGWRLGSASAWLGFSGSGDTCDRI